MLTGLPHFVATDGGRATAGFTGTAPGDCVVRAWAVALERPYRDVYDELHTLQRAMRVKNPSPRDGMTKKACRRYASENGWVWTPTMAIGSGCTVHLRGDELPDGRLVVSVSKHLCAVIDGVVHDLYDPSRLGTRCVYGYWSACEVCNATRTVLDPNDHDRTTRCPECTTPRSAR